VPYQENCEEKHYNVLPKMLCTTLRMAIFWIESHKNELLRVKVTIYFRASAAKNLISVQCVNCSGSLVTINFITVASKFPILVSSSIYTYLFHFFCMKYRQTSAMVCKIFIFLWQKILYFLNFFQYP
jgi:hypothetical protein